MSDEKQSFMGGLKANLTVIIGIIAIIGTISGIAVTYNKVDEHDGSIEVLDTGQTEAHDDIDILKIRIVQELYEVKIEALKERHRLELLISSEKIERLESQLEYYKNK